MCCSNEEGLPAASRKPNALRCYVVEARCATYHGSSGLNKLCSIACPGKFNSPNNYFSCQANSTPQLDLEAYVIVTARIDLILLLVNEIRYHKHIHHPMIKHLSHASQTTRTLLPAYPPPPAPLHSPPRLHHPQIPSNSTPPSPTLPPKTHLTHPPPALRPDPPSNLSPNLPPTTLPHLSQNHRPTNLPPTSLPPNPTRKTQNTSRPRPRAPLKARGHLRRRRRRRAGA